MQPLGATIFRSLTQQFCTACIKEVPALALRHLARISHPRHIAVTLPPTPHVLHHRLHVRIAHRASAEVDLSSSRLYYQTISV
uniref:Uncharacterized protein n=1 Tax=Plectus sambesii TaxID=2011161 RepID=A0A914WV88_9BILA